MDRKMKVLAVVAVALPYAAALAAKVFHLVP
jgi:hypothetical protein